MIRYGYDLILSHLRDPIVSRSRVPKHVSINELLECNCADHRQCKAGSCGEEDGTVLMCHQERSLRVERARAATH